MEFTHLNRFVECKYESSIIAGKLSDLDEIDNFFVVNYLLDDSLRWSAKLMTYKINKCVDLNQNMSISSRYVPNYNFHQKQLKQLYNWSYRT